MKAILFVFASVIIPVLILISCTKSKDSTRFQAVDPDTLTITHSLKGWELYSWTGDEAQYFAILQGTDRLKSYEEVVTTPIRTEGVESLKRILDRFPEGEVITMIGPGWLKQSWGSGYGNLSLPGEPVIAEIAAYCRVKKLVLQVTG